MYVICAVVLAACFTTLWAFKSRLHAALLLKGTLDLLSLALLTAGGVNGFSRGLSFFLITVSTALALIVFKTVNLPRRLG